MTMIVDVMNAVKVEKKSKKEPIFIKRFHKYCYESKTAENVHLRQENIPGEYNWMTGVIWLKLILKAVTVMCL